jgi:hypothetical protein
MYLVIVVIVVAIVFVLCNDTQWRNYEAKYQHGRRRVSVDPD